MSWRDWFKPRFRNSVVQNCYIKSREGEKHPKFQARFDGRGDAIVHLDGYAIIPIEEYEALTLKERSDG